MKARVILDSKKFSLTIDRLCHQLIENHRDFSNSALIGIQPRGVFLGHRVHQRLQDILGVDDIQYGKIDFTFHRDDLLKRDLSKKPYRSEIDFSIDSKRIILIDDVLYTGRTIRATLDALIQYGRPEDVELMVLVDRRLMRNVPIQAKYVGKVVDSINSEMVRVEWKENDGTDKIWIVPANSDE